MHSTLGLRPRPFLPRVLSALTLLLHGVSVSAQIDAPPELQPGDLAPGDTFFVIFATSTTVDACVDVSFAPPGGSLPTPAEIAAAQPPALDALGASTAAAGSETSGVTGWQTLYIHFDGTDTVQASAAFNNVTDRPIYNVREERVANSRDDLFDGSGFDAGTPLINPITYDENGTTNANSLAYTGFGRFGDARYAVTISEPLEPASTLGPRNAVTGCLAGQVAAANRDWVERGQSSNPRSLYVLSPLLRIPNAVSGGASLTDW